MDIIIYNFQLLAALAISKRLLSLAQVWLATRHSIEVRLLGSGYTKLAIDKSWARRET